MKTKKTISLGLTLALALSLITPALAAPHPTGDLKGRLLRKRPLPVF